MKLKRLDAFDINFVDSAAIKEFKLNTSTGNQEYILATMRQNTTNFLNLIILNILSLKKRI